MHIIIFVYIKGEVSESVLTSKQCPPFGSERQADIKLSVRPLNTSSPFIFCQWHLQRWCLRAMLCAFQVCRHCVHHPRPRACSKKFPYEISASSGTSSCMDVTCLVSLGRNIPFFRLSMHKKLAKCVASSMIRFLFHRTTVIYETYFHVVTRKCFHLTTGQWSFLYQTSLKNFYCFRIHFHRRFLALTTFRFKGALLWFAKTFRLLDEACGLLEQAEETWADGQCAKQELRMFHQLLALTLGFWVPLSKSLCFHECQLPIQKRRMVLLIFPCSPSACSSLLTADPSLEALVLTGACWVPSMVRVRSPGCHTILINHSNKSCQRNIN